jgi:macrolide transport system ATP-binding/permease protein
MISIKNLSKIYTTGKIEFKALDNVSLDIPAGEFVAIMGASGSGKSTLLHILGLLDRQTSGEYSFRNQSINNYSESQLAKLRSTHLGFIFQQFHLLARTSAYKNVALPLIYSGNRPTSNLPYELLKTVKLEDKAANYPNELSGGQRQRVAIARALINDPEIIIADEPTGNLDSKSEAEIMEILLGLNRQGKTVLLVTHEESLAKIAGRIIRLKDGRIIEDNHIKPQIKIKVTDRKVSATKVVQSFQLLEYIKQAWTMIFSNKVRSFLSILGILIGIGTVVAMMMLGTGAKMSIQDALARLGTNMITVRSNRVAGQVPVRFTLRDIESIQKLLCVKRVSPQVRGNVIVVAGNKNISSQVLGTNVTASQMRNNKPEYGRYFTKEEVNKREKVVVIGQTVLKDIFDNSNPIGKIIKINKHNFNVIGVMQELGGSSWRDRDNVVFIPISTAMYRLLGKKYLDTIDIEISKDFEMEKAIEDIKQLIIKQHNLIGKRRETFRIINMAEIQETAQATTKNLSFLMSFIASLSLLVGGIGIMNIMLVSVTERTREIGLRKAIGAQKKDILFQFIIESIIMTFTGGVAGTVLGLTIGFTLTHFAGWVVNVTFNSILLACLFSSSVGLVFGIWPAKKAANLDPIEALRYE